MKGVLSWSTKTPSFGNVKHFPPKIHQTHQNKTQIFVSIHFAAADLQFPPPFSLPFPKRWQGVIGFFLVAHLICKRQATELPVRPATMMLKACEMPTVMAKPQSGPQRTGRSMVVYFGSTPRAPGCNRGKYRFIGVPDPKHESFLDVWLLQFFGALRMGWRFFPFCKYWYNFQKRSKQINHGNTSINHTLRTRYQCRNRNWYRFVLKVNHTCILFQWLFLVPVKGGRDYITPQKAIYKWYISGIYCQLGDYMPPTTF